MMAGALRHRLQLQGYADGRDRAGQPTKIWSTYATVWASVESLTGQKLFQAQQVAPRASHKILIRGRQPLTVDQRVVFRDRVFNVLYAVRLEERNQTIEMLAVEIPASQFPTPAQAPYAGFLRLDDGGDTRITDDGFVRAAG